MRLRIVQKSNNYCDVWECQDDSGSIYRVDLVAANANIRDKLLPGEVIEVARLYPYVTIGIGVSLLNEHWFKKSCGYNPVSCTNKRDNKCDDPVVDCLLYEKLELDIRQSKEGDREDAREESI